MLLEETPRHTILGFRSTGRLEQELPEFSVLGPFAFLQPPRQAVRSLPNIPLLVLGQNSRATLGLFLQKTHASYTSRCWVAILAPRNSAS